MKNFIITLCALFICTVSHAQTETMNWYVEGALYDTTTCESGGDIDLPAITPTKRGYTFQGWWGYTQLEYLESTGTQYIDTGYVPSSQGYIATGKMRFVGSQNNWASVLGGDHSSVPTSSKFGRYYYTNNWAATLGCSNDSYSVATFDIGSDYSFEISFIIGNRYLKINDETVITSSCDTVVSTAGSVFLFTFNRTSSLSSEAMKGRIYYIKIYDDNDTLVRDFVPVLDYNGVPCMFDKVTETFFYNQGTGDFIAGPIVSE